MQNLLSTCLALVILGGGFALTGDLARLADRSLKVLQATDVPGTDTPVTAATDPAATNRPMPSAAPLAPPGGVLDAVDVTTLPPGSRVVIWIRHAGRTQAVDFLHVTCDLVDPAGREALVSEAEAAPAAGAPALAPAPPRRAIVMGSGPSGTIVRGGTLDVRPQGIAGAGACETLGPVFAIDVQH